MAESIVQVTEGSGKKLHTYQRTIGANVIEDEFVLLGVNPYASYVADSGAVSTATAASHEMQLMAGASLKVYVYRITIEQTTNATAGAAMPLAIVRLTTAGTGGTAITPRPFDTTDAASGATAMTLPTVKGTVGVTLIEGVLTMRQTVAAAGAQVDDLYQWVSHPNMKPIVIPAGTTNGIALQNTSAIAGANAIVTMEFVELNY